MNERVERKLTRIKNMIANIRAICECALEDCDDITESSDLFVIESQVDRIIRQANDAKDTVVNTYDDFDE